MKRILPAIVFVTLVLSLTSFINSPGPHLYKVGHFEPATDTPQVSNWNYKDDFDSMSHTKRFEASITSRTQLHFTFPYEGGSTGKIAIRNYGDGNEVMFIISKGQLLHGEGHPVYVSFDAGKPIEFKTSGTSDYDPTILFISPSGKFIKNAMKSQLIIIQAEYYESGRRQLEFDSQGLVWQH